MGLLISIGTSPVMLRAWEHKMQITVTGRHTDVSDSLRTYAEEKSAKLERFYDRVQTVEVVFDVDAGKQRCEMIARADHHTTFVAKELHVEAFAALDAAVKDIERQLNRHKEKHRNRKHPDGVRADHEPFASPASGDATDEFDDVGEPS